MVHLHSPHCRLPPLSHHPHLRLTQPDADIYHFFNCIKLRKTFVNFAHDIIVIELTNILTSLGFFARKETQLDDGSKKRPDITLITSLAIYLLEITIRNPCAPTYLSDHANPSKTLTTADNAKTSKYAAEVKMRSMRETLLVAAWKLVRRVCDRSV